MKEIEKQIILQFIKNIPLFPKYLYRAIRRYGIKRVFRYFKNMHEFANAHRKAGADLETTEKRLRDKFR